MNFGVSMKEVCEGELATKSVLLPVSGAHREDRTTERDGTIEVNAMKNQ